MVTKRQHYISEGVLKSFCNQSGGLYELLVYEKHLYGTSPVNAMCETYTYEHKKISENGLENEFSELESKIIPKIDAIIAQTRVADEESLQISTIKEEIFNILPSVLIFYYRSNALLQEYSMGNRDFKIPLMLEKITNNEYIVRLASIIKRNYSFCILKTGSSFLISDQYISTCGLKIKGVFYDISNRHIGIKDSLILIPLSKDYYIAFWHSTIGDLYRKDSINLLDEKRTFLVNRVIVNNSYTKCVAAEEKLLKGMSQYWKHQSPTQIFIGHSKKISSGFTKKKEIFYYVNDQDAYEDVLTNTVMLGKYINMKGGEKCPCKSGRQFKNCHLKLVKIVRPAYEQFGKRGHIEEITVDGGNFHELPIDSWGPMSKRYVGHLGR
jgi:hypothetical protein